MKDPWGKEQEHVPLLGDDDEEIGEVTQIIETNDHHGNMVVEMRLYPGGVIDADEATPSGITFTARIPVA